MTSEHSTHKAGMGALTIGALGVVFGDIGTSPLYTLKEGLHASGGHNAPQADLYGILSLIFWSITFVVTVKYLTFILSADNKGEGGIFALLALVPEQLRTARPGMITTVAVFAAMGAALLYGDGVITPAISVLGAVEGLAIADPAWAQYVVPLSCAILIGLFSIQSRGTGTVGILFGPVMLVWFLTLGLLGIYHLTINPEILWAISPHHAVEYFARHGWPGLHILSSVVLAITGGEALYADMGHFGVKPIRRAWLWIVFPCLILGYFGQGAHVLRDPTAAANPMFTMVPQGPATIALVILSSTAAVIASQALISGSFSLTRQAVQLGFFPRFNIRHTAHDMEGQIYIPRINYFLGIGCVLLVLVFRESSKLAAAYGIAVSGTMAITSVMFFLVARKTWKWGLGKSLAVLVGFLALDLPFLAANLGKFKDGVDVPVMIGAVVLGIMLIWNRGRSLMGHRARVRFSSWDAAEARVNKRLAARVPGTAVFMNSNSDMLPWPLVRHVERSRALHETVVLLTVKITGEPVVPEAERFTWEHLPSGFHRIVMRFGFMDDLHILPELERVVAAHKIPFVEDEVTYYLGRENLIASSKGQMGVVAESIFAFLHRNAVPADRFFGLPPRQVVELGTQMDL
ncbi:MAG: KUP/HAK/KT family potassium transporter [Acidobacteriota bacterium]